MSLVKTSINWALRMDQLLAPRAKKRTTPNFAIAQTLSSGMY